MGTQNAGSTQSKLLTALLLYMSRIIGRAQPRIQRPIPHPLMPGVRALAHVYVRICVLGGCISYVAIS